MATVGDEKLALQMKSLDAQIAGLEAQLAQAQTDLTRAEDLFGKGTIAPIQARRGPHRVFNVASNALRARIAERSVIQQQLTEGRVLAPAAGRVLKVPLTTGTVVMPGDPVAQIAEQNFVLRLRVPERHARFLKAGDTIRIDAAELGESEPRFGTIQLVYPQIEDGRVVADAVVEGLGDYFVSERIRVWVSAGEPDGLRHPGALRHDAIRHRLRQGQHRQRRGCRTCRSSAAASCRAPICPMASRSCPASNAGDRLVKP